LALEHYFWCRQTGSTKFWHWPIFWMAPTRSTSDRRTLHVL